MAQRCSEADPVQWPWCSPVGSEKAASGRLCEKARAVRLRVLALNEVA